MDDLMGPAVSGDQGVRGSSWTPAPSSAQTTQNAGQHDTLTQASGNRSNEPNLTGLQKPKISILEFSKLISETLLLAEEQFEQNERHDIDLLKKFHRLTQSEIARLKYLTSLNSSQDYFAKEVVKDQNNSIEDLNCRLKDYQSSIKEIILKDHDKAIQLNELLEKEDDLDKINKKIADYNSYVKSRNEKVSSLNQDLNSFLENYQLSTDEYNRNAALMNQALVQVGFIGKYPDQLNVPNVSLANPISLISGNQPVPLVTPSEVKANAEVEIDVKEISDQIHSFLADAINLTLGHIRSFNNIADLIEREIDISRQSNRDWNLIVPKQLMGSSAERPIFSGSADFNLASLATGIEQAGLNVAFLQDSLLAIANGSGVLLPGKFYEKIQLEILRMMGQTALNSTFGAMGLLGSGFRNSSGKSVAIQVAVSAAYCSNLAQNSFKDALYKMIKSELRLLQREVRNQLASGMPLDPQSALIAELSPGKMGQLSKSISLALHLALLEGALYQMGIALGMPGLGQQISAQVLNVDNFSMLALSNCIKNILLSPVALQDLKTASEAAFVKEKGMDEVEVHEMIEDILQFLVRFRRQLDRFEMGFILHKRFQKLGLNLLDAIFGTNVVVSNLRGLLGVKGLDRPLNPLFDKQAVIAAVIASAILKGSILAQTRFKEALSKSIVVAAAGSLRELRHDLVLQLHESGFRRQESLWLANQVVKAIQDGVIAPETGIVPEKITAIKNRLSLKGISSNVIETLMQETIRLGPFSTEDEFFFILSAVAKQKGISTPLESAIASLSPEPINPLANSGNVAVLNREEIQEKIFNGTYDLLTKELGKAQAEKLAYHVVSLLFGAMSQAESQKPISRVVREEEQALQAIAQTPIEGVLKRNLMDICIGNAQLGCLMSSLFEPPNQALNTALSLQGTTGFSIPGQPS